MSEATVTFHAFDANGNPIEFTAQQNTITQGLAPHHVIESNGLPNSATNPIFEKPGAITPVAGAAFLVASGGTAITAIDANPNGIGGGKIINLGTVAGFCDFVNTAGTLAPGTFGTTIPIAVNGTLDLPAGCANAVTLNSTDSNHGFVVISW